MDANVDKIVENDFEGLSRADVGKLAGNLGVEFKPNHSREFIIKLIKEHLGIVEDEQKLPEVPKAKPIRAKPGSIVPNINLMPGGTWGGRKHIITLHASNERDHGKALKITWMGSVYLIPFDEEIVCPEPVYEILKNTEGKTLVGRLVVDPSTGRKKYEWKTVPKPRFSFSHRGIDPDTADLPGSIEEHFQRQAKKIGTAPKGELIQSLRLLRKGPPDGKRWETMPEDELRFFLRERVGLSPFEDDFEDDFEDEEAEEAA